MTQLDRIEGKIDALLAALIEFGFRPSAKLRKEIERLKEHTP